MLLLSCEERLEDHLYVNQSVILVRNNRSGVAGIVTARVPLSGAATAGQAECGANRFLPDEGIATRGLPWTTANNLVKWETAKPVAAAPYLKSEGLTLHRSGKARVAVEGRGAVALSVEVAGNQVGIQRVNVSFDMAELDLDRAERSLIAEGQLSPLKCNRRTEGASFGNVVYVAKASGKTATGLWESWNCSATECFAAFSILYRKNEVAKINCAPGS